MTNIEGREKHRPLRAIKRVSLSGSKQGNVWCSKDYADMYSGNIIEMSSMAVIFREIF